MLNWVRGLWSTKSLWAKGFFFDRPLLLIQSDDWGRLGVRDREGFEVIRAAGVHLGDQPYDLYSLETAEDLAALSSVLRRHHDSAGRSPSVVMNFLVANLDFPKIAQSGFRNIQLKWLAEGLPGNWKRPGLLEAYGQGVAEGLFYPALHGISHFCRRAVERELAANGERAELLQALWKAETPYIFWRMPWIGYEYWDPERPPKERALPAEQQADLIRQGVHGFSLLFGKSAASACAPGYRADHNTHSTWAQAEVKVAQNGPGGLTAPYFDDEGLLNICRNIDFEPAFDAKGFSVEQCLHAAAECFARGIPAVVSSHSINFHSSLQDFRTPTLQFLDQFLSGLEAKYPSILYVNDADIFELVTHGRYATARGSVSLNVIQQKGHRSMSTARRT
jgi:hypothetical protein